MADQPDTLNALLANIISECQRDIDRAREVLDGAERRLSKLRGVRVRLDFESERVIISDETQPISVEGPGFDIEPPMASYDRHTLTMTEEGDD